MYTYIYINICKSAGGVGLKNAEMYQQKKNINCISLIIQSIKPETKLILYSIIPQMFIRHTKYMYTYVYK